MPKELVALDIRKPALRDYEDGPVPEGRVRVKVEFGSPKRGTELTLYRGDRMPGFPTLAVIAISAARPEIIQNIKDWDPLLPSWIKKKAFVT